MSGKVFKRMRAETRRQQFDRVHGNVLKGRTARDMWLVYARERFESAGMDLDDPAIKETVEHAFYSGLASMMELMNRVSPADITEEQGVEMLQRLYEELETYAERTKLR